MYANLFFSENIYFENARSNNGVYTHLHGIEYLSCSIHSCFNVDYFDWFENFGNIRGKLLHEITEPAKKKRSNRTHGYIDEFECAPINIFTIKLLSLSTKKKTWILSRVRFSFLHALCLIYFGFNVNDEWCCNLRADMRMKITQVAYVHMYLFCCWHTLCAPETENRLLKRFELMFKQQAVNTRFHLISSLSTQYLPYFTNNSLFNLLSLRITHLQRLSIYVELDVLVHRPTCLLITSTFQYPHAISCWMEKNFPQTVGSEYYIGWVLVTFLTFS